MKVHVIDHGFWSTRLLRREQNKIVIHMNFPSELFHMEKTLSQFIVIELGD